LDGRVHGQRIKGGIVKLRKGFVSNSSSTSFCIIGKYFNNKLIQQNDKIKKTMWGDPEDFDFHSDQDGDGIYIGISAYGWAKLDINYTELVKKIEKMFEEAGLPNDKIEIMTDGWFDG
jgi:hypothetical protein